jgi:hypothetical protein
MVQETATLRKIENFNETVFKKLQKAVDEFRIVNFNSSEPTLTLSICHRDIAPESDPWEFQVTRGHFLKTLPKFLNFDDGFGSLLYNPGFDRMLQQR